MLIDFQNGQTSIILRVKLRQDTTGAKPGYGKTGLTNSSTGLNIGTIADNEASSTAYTSAGSTIDSITTLGTFATPTATHCEFKEVDATNHPGIYEIQIANARFAVSNAKSLVLSITGVSGVIDCDVTVPLRAVNPYDGVHGGMSAIPNTACTTNASLLTSGTGTDQLSVASGQVNVGKINSIATTSVTTVSAIQGTTTAITFDGNSLPIVDVGDWLGHAVTVDANNAPNVSAKYWAGTAITATSIPVATTAGAAGGLFIAGTNAATVITTSLTTHFVGTVDTVTTYTGNTPQTGDSYARLGAPTGASASVDIAAVKSSVGSPQQVGTKYAVTLAAGDVSGNLSVDLQTIKTQTVTCGASVTVGAFVGNANAALDVDGSGQVTFNNTSLSGSVGSVTGSVGSVVGSVGSVAGDVGGNLDGNVNGNVQGNLGGNVNGNVNGNVASVTGNVGGDVNGNVGGNVNGSVASVTAAITLPGIPADWITATGIQAAALNGKGDWVTSTGSDTPGTTTLLARLTSGRASNLDNLDAAVSTRSTYAGGAVASVTAGVTLAASQHVIVDSGTVTTVTNLTNAPTSGDLTATMKASVTTAATAATPTAFLSVGTGTGQINLSNGRVPIVSGLTKDAALSNFSFFMKLSSDHLSGALGLNVVCQRSIDSGSFADCTNTPATEDSNGWYRIDLSAADMNGAMIRLKFLATGADPCEILLITTP